MNSLGVLVLYLGIAAAHDKLSIVKFPLTSPEQSRRRDAHNYYAWCYAVRYQVPTTTGNWAGM